MQDAVLGLDGLGVGLVGTLHGDHAHQFGRQIDVRLFQSGGLQHTILARGARSAGDGVAATRGLRPDVVAQRLHALRVAEGGKNDLPDHSRLAVGIATEDGAVLTDVEARQGARAVAVLNHGIDREAGTELRRAGKIYREGHGIDGAGVAELGRSDVGSE